jgi:hypothetical protein
LLYVLTFIRIGREILDRGYYGRISYRIREPANQDFSLEMYDTYGTSRTALSRGPARETDEARVKRRWHARANFLPSVCRERQRALSTHFPVLADSSTFSTHPCRSSQSCVELLLAQCDSWRLMLVGARYDATYPTPHSRVQSAPRSLSVEGDVLPRALESVLR